MDPVWLAEAAGERIGHVHLKDVSAETAEQLRSNELTFLEVVRAGPFRPLGIRAAPIAERLHSLAAAGYDGLYVLEQDRALTSARTATARSRTWNDAPRSCTGSKPNERKEGT